MQTIKISDFRANLLSYLEKAESGEQISVASNGKILATISPPMDQKSSGASRGLAPNCRLKLLC